MRWIVTGLAVTVLIAAGLIYWSGLVAYDRHTGYYAPVFAPGEDAVYYIQRDTTGFSWGLGWEGFSGPASARAISDTISLRRLELATGDVTILEAWGPTPIVGRTIQSYRPKLYKYLGVRLRAETPDRVEYAFKFSLKIGTTIRQYGVSGVWSTDHEIVERGEWGEDFVSLSGHSRWPIRDTVDLFEVYAYGAHPPALLTQDHQTGTTIVLLETKAYRALFPDGVAPERIAAWSKRDAMIRIQNLERTHAELTTRFEAEGLSSHQVSMRVIDEMQRLGFYPAPDTLTARLLATGETLPALPVFAIAYGEMASGVFPDIEKAVATAGEAVEKGMGRYVIHRDYQNSAKLNEFFDAGGTRMIVRYQGHDYEVTYDKPQD